MTCAFDFETFLIERPVAAPRPVCMAWTDDNFHEGVAHVESFNKGDALETCTKFVNGDELLVNQTIAFDLTCLIAAEPDLVAPVFRAYADDRVCSIDLDQKLIDIAKGELKWRKSSGGYALDSLARRHRLPIPDKDNPWRLRFGELDNLPIEMYPEDAQRYVEEDALLPLQIYKLQRQIDKRWTAEHGTPILHQSAARARYDFALRLAAIWGVRCDPTRVAELKAATERRMYELWKKGWTSVKGKRHAPLTDTRATYFDAKKGKQVEECLVRVSGSKNMKAAQAMVERTFTELGLAVPMTEPKPNPKTGKTAAPQISTSRDTCILSGSDALEDFADYARTGTLIKRIEDLGKGVVLPLQPRYDSLLESGRTSSSKGASKKPLPRDLVGVQIQNFPRSPDEEIVRVMRELGFDRISDARSCILPRPGHVFILADYASGELHTLAQCHRDWFGHSTLGDMLNDGVDVHLWFGVLAYGDGVSYDEAKRRLAAGDKQVKAWRQSAKPIVFGRPGGMGKRKMVITARKSYGVRFSLEEAGRLIALYDHAVPELVRQFDMVKGLLGGGEKCLIKHMRSDRWRGGCSYSAANNSFFQGLLADGALDATFEVQQECYATPESKLYGSRTIAMVHDELVCESEIAKASDAVKRLSHIMEACLNVYTPDYPTPAEPVVTRIWSKDAKGIVDANGNMVAWEPRRLAA